MIIIVSVEQEREISLDSWLRGREDSDHDEG